MKTFGALLQSGDWKGEKHVPIIHCPDKVKANEEFDLKISIGDAVGHPGLRSSSYPRGKNSLLS